MIEIIRLRYGWWLWRREIRVFVDWKTNSYRYEIIKTDKQ